MMTHDSLPPENKNDEKEVVQEQKNPAKKEEKPQDSGSLPAAATGDTVEFESGLRTADMDSLPKTAQPSSVEHGESKGLKTKIRKRDAELNALKKENEELKKNLEEFRDKYLRKLAEMENLRKRTEREMAEHTKFALVSVLNEMLVILDNFERALQNRDQTDGKIFQEGVEMIYRQYLDLLRKKGIESIPTEDKTFNPELHHAFLTEESDEVLEPQVAEIFQKGYLLYGKLLRPVLVKVRVPKKG